jgi:hypothetical protein
VNCDDFEPSQDEDTYKASLEACPANVSALTDYGTLLIRQVRYERL